MSAYSRDQKKKYPTKKISENSPLDLSRTDNSIIDRTIFRFNMFSMHESNFLVLLLYKNNQYSQPADFFDDFSDSQVRKFKCTLKRKTTNGKFVW